MSLNQPLDSTPINTPARPLRVRTSGTFGNTPSANALQSTVDLYRATVSQLGGGQNVSYPSTADVPAVACAVQAKSVAQDNGEGRINVLTWFDVYFRADYGVAIKDKLVWVDATGADRQLFVVGTIDQAGLGRAFGVRCEEMK